MIFDLSGDPVLKEIGHEAAGGATVFSALVLLYVASAREATEIRVAHVDHFEFALLFPASPYQSCKLDVPLDDLASCFQLDLSGEERPLTGLMSPGEGDFRCPSNEAAAASRVDLALLGLFRGALSGGQWT